MIFLHSLIIPRRTFTMTLQNEPFSLESDNPNVIPANNLMIFINGIFQEPGVSYSLNGSIIKFNELQEQTLLAHCTSILVLMKIYSFLIHLTQLILQIECRLLVKDLIVQLQRSQVRLQLILMNTLDLDHKLHHSQHINCWCCY